MDFQGVLRQRHHMSRIFFELQLYVQEQNWGDAYECASRCAALQLPAAHRTYLVAVALKAASEAAKRGGDGVGMWCRVGMATTTTALEKQHFAALLARASLAAGKWEAAMAAARVMMKLTTTAADPACIIALLAATMAAKNVAGAQAENDLLSIMNEMSNNSEAVPEASMVHVAKRVVAVVDGIYDGRVALAFLDAAAATAIHYKRAKSGKFLLFNLSYRISRGLSNSAFDALVSYVQWFVATYTRNKSAVANSTVHEDVVRLCDGQIDYIISTSSCFRGIKDSCAEETSTELDTVLKWCDATICLCQQAEDAAAIQNFLAKKLLLLLNTGNINAANAVMSDYGSLVKEENPIFIPMLVRSAVLNKDLAAVEKRLYHLTKTKFPRETDVAAVIIGLLVEGGDVLQMDEIADILERMLHTSSGTESGGKAISEMLPTAVAVRSLYSSCFKYTEPPIQSIIDYGGNFDQIN